MLDLSLHRCGLSHSELFVGAFLVLVHRDIALNGSLGFSLERMNMNTKTIDSNRHMFFLLTNKTFDLLFL